MSPTYIRIKLVEIQATGLASKAITAANKIAPAWGTWVAWTAPAGEGDLANKMNFYVEALKGFKIADPIKTTTIAFAQPDRYPIAGGISLAATGYLIDLVGEGVGGGSGSLISRMGKIAIKGGAALAVNSIVASYIFEARNNPHGAASPQTALSATGMTEANYGYNPRLAGNESMALVSTPGAYEGVMY